MTPAYVEAKIMAIDLYVYKKKLIYWRTFAKCSNTKGIRTKNLVLPVSQIICSVFFADHSQ